MLVDTQPATHQHQPASVEVRERWVDARLIGVLMEGLWPSLIATSLTFLIVLFVMAGDVPDGPLIAWGLVVAVLMAYRYRIVSTYQMRYDNYEGAQRELFISKYLWTWVAAGFMWGLISFLVYLQAPVLTQFVCGMLVLGHGLMSLTAFSPYLPVFNAYIHGLFGATAVGVTFNALILGPVAGHWTHSGALLIALLVSWRLLVKAARRLNRVYRSSYELQFSNQELIDSLTQQTRASLRAVAAKNRFLASAAHDLRQPVHALSLYADWLVTEPEMGKDIAPRMLQSTRAINELFDSLFDLTRIDAGNYKVRLQAVDVEQLFEDLSTQFMPVAAAKSLKFRTHTRPRTIWADPVVLRRILGNLLSNAIKHTHSGGVLVGLRRRKDSLVFEVWDTGVGIAHEHQMAIFQEFFRVSLHQGTEDSLGLGLTIVSKLSTLMGYQLAVSSTEGRGSVFRVLLPAFTQSKVQPREPLMPEVVLNSGLGILE